MAPGCTALVKAFAPGMDAGAVRAMPSPLPLGSKLLAEVFGAGDSAAGLPRSASAGRPFTDGSSTTDEAVVGTGGPPGVCPPLLSEKAFRGGSAESRGMFKSAAGDGENPLGWVDVVGGALGIPYGGRNVLCASRSLALTSRWRLIGVEVEVAVVGGARTVEVPAPGTGLDGTGTTVRAGVELPPPPPPPEGGPPTRPASPGGTPGSVMLRPPFHRAVRPES